MDNHSIINNIRQELIHSSDELSKAASQRFFKEAIKNYGVKNPLVEKIGKKHYQLIKDKTKDDIFSYCNELWQSGYIEESFIACHWSYYVRKDYTAQDFELFGKWVETYVSNWASCDTLCNHTIGDFLVMYPEFIPELKIWAKSTNRWLRRAAAVSLIIPAKNGLFLKDILEIAGILLTDADDLVQKGYGWMLKSASHPYQQEIFDYVMDKKSVMPRTALRYAIEKMPAALKAKAMDLK